MSDESETDDEQKTEAPSERRLQQAFEQGDIALSQELVTTGAFVIGLVALLTSATLFQTRLTRLVTETMSLVGSAPFQTLPSMILPLVLPAAVVMVAMAVGAIALTFSQTRGHLWTDRVSPDFARVFSWGRLSQLASKQFGADLLISLGKLLAVAVVCWSSLKTELLSVPRLAHMPPGDALRQLFAGVVTVGLRAVALLAVFAAVNYGLTRWRYTKKHRMTKEEIKREMREDEGDPMMRGARKRKHREMVKRNAVAETKQADVLIVNPTHIAIAVRYRKDEGGAPKVLAKGKGVLAEAMREAARSNSVPIVQDIPLARLLYKKVKIGGVVPAETYKAVAAILAFVYRMTGRAAAQQAGAPPAN